MQENFSAAEALPQTLLGKLTALYQYPELVGMGLPPPSKESHPHSRSFMPSADPQFTCCTNNSANSEPTASRQLINVYYGTFDGTTMEMNASSSMTPSRFLSQLFHKSFPL